MKDDSVSEIVKSDSLICQIMSLELDKTNVKSPDYARNKGRMLGRFLLFVRKRYENPDLQFKDLLIPERFDIADFTYSVLKFADEAAARSAPPEAGCYLNGFFLEGAAWDDEQGILRESDPKVIHVPLPVMHFIPVY